MKKIQTPHNDPLWKAVLVDDEPRSRAIARRMLTAYPAFSVVAECANGYEALAAVSEFQPHLMLLDIQMPEMDGFEVVKKISPEQLPVVAFLTAFDQYAVRAFEVHALDYLLKPFDEERFASMMQRVEERLTLADGPVYARRVFSMLESLTAANSYAERFVVRMHGKILVIPVTEVDWIKAEDNYIRIHTASSSYLERETLSSVYDRLDPKKFLRVHRSVMVNVDRIKEVSVINGEYELVLKSGVRVALSRTYRDEFFARFGNAKPESSDCKKN